MSGTAAPGTVVSTGALVTPGGAQGPRGATGTGGGGGVTTTGTPATGNLTAFSGATTITNGNLSGDLTTAGSLVTTLATVNSNVGTYQGLSVNAKGLVTAAANQSYAPLANPTFSAGLFETRVAMAANNIDLNTGSLFSKTISGATTLTVSNVPASGTLATFLLDLTNGGSATITWWANVRWAGGAAPTLTASGRDVLGFFTYDAGANWSGLLLGKGMA